MTARSRLPGRILAVIMFTALTATVSGAAETLDPDTDGWHSWSVPAPPGAVERCCHGWSEQRGCDLESSRGGLSSCGNLRDDSGYTRIYLLVESGQPERIAALSPLCEIRTATAITDHGRVDPDTSVDWLRRLAAADSGIGSEALAALSLHGGDYALHALVDIVESGADDELREEALFWLIQSGSDAGFAWVDRLLSAD
jgi:hypothetical protein